MANELTVLKKPWTQEELALVKATAAPRCSDEEFQLLLYQAKTYKLDPLLKQIWAVKYHDGKPASIFVGRDGYLSIAHQSGQFDGMDSGTRGDGDDLIGFASVWRRDMKQPFKVEVALKEYNKKSGNWLTMPRTMIQKVAESQALRRAFNISGVYAPEEMPEAPAQPIRVAGSVVDAEVVQQHPASAVKEVPIKTGKQQKVFP